MLFSVIISSRAKHFQASIAALAMTTITAASITLWAVGKVLSRRAHLVNVPSNSGVPAQTRRRSIMASGERGTRGPWVALGLSDDLEKPRRCHGVYLLRTGKFAHTRGMITSAARYCSCVTRQETFGAAQLDDDDSAQVSYNHCIALSFPLEDE